MGQATCKQTVVPSSLHHKGPNRRNKYYYEEYPRAEA